MRLPLSLLDVEDPGPPDANYIARGDVAELALADVLRAGVSVLQGPAGSGMTSLAAACAATWEGTVVWKRAGLFFHLADLARPLWDQPPAALQQAPAEQAVEAVLGRLREGRVLWVLDDFDEALEPAPSPAVARDPDVGLLLAALEAGELAESGAGVLVVTRRTPRGLSAPSRPIPPLGLDAASALAGRDLGDADPAWRRRPGALALFPALPDGSPLPRSPTAPFDDLLASIADGLDSTTATVLLTAAMGVHPVGALALHSATGLPREDVSQAVANLTMLRLLVPRGPGRRCLRHVAEAAVTVLPDLVPDVLAEPTLGRLAAFYVRQGSGTGRGWESVDPAITARFGLRLSARAGYPQMAVNLALYGGHAPVLERFQAWRHLRDDLGVGLARRNDDLGALEEARARFARAQAALNLRDYGVVYY